MTIANVPFEARLRRLAVMERDHFWFEGRKELLAHFLRRVPRGQRILDVGAGTGSISAGLVARGYEVVAIDRERTAFSAWPPALAGGQVRILRAQGEALPLRSASFDGVIALDVLEHADDAQLLRELGRVVRPGGWLLVAVPAFSFLWSWRDEAAGHLRRYDAKTLRTRVLEAGFTVLELRPYQTLLFPLVALTRLLGRRGPRLRDLEDAPPRVLNALLKPVARLDGRLGARLRWPIGSSLFAFARKDGTRG